MNLLITNTKELDLKDFLTWLIPKIQDYFNSILDERKLIKFQTVVDDELIWEEGVFNAIYITDIVMKSIELLELKTLPNSYEILINENQTIPGTYTTYISIAKLINYGNLSVNAYPVYSKTFDFISKNISDYYTEYKNEVM